MYKINVNEKKKILMSSMYAYIHAKSCLCNVKIAELNRALKDHVGSKKPIKRETR